MRTRRAKKATGEDGGAEASAARKSPRKRPCTDRKGEEEDRDVAAAWLDPDASSLDCGVCFMPFEAEVFMCYNGHAACAKCCLLINRRCWVCREAIGDIRCRPLESVLAEINTPCRFSRYGCEEIVTYAEKRKHEERCPCEPVRCPVAVGGGCGYLGASTCLYDHVLGEHPDEVSTVSYLRTTEVTVHKSAPFCLLLTRSRARRVFLLLNGGHVLAGRSLSLVCLAPPRPEGDDGDGDGDAAGVKYKMEVRGEDGSAHKLVAATAPCIRHLEGFEPKKFLFVPDADWGPSARVSVSIRIG